MSNLSLESEYMELWLSPREPKNKFQNSPLYLRALHMNKMNLPFEYTYSYLKRIGLLKRK